MQRLMLVAFVVTMAAGCGKKADIPTPECETTLDCPGDKLCIDGTCTVPVCTGDECENNGADAGNNGDNNGTPDLGDNNGEVDMGAPDEGVDMREFDNVPPEVVEVVPANDTVDVALDATVAVTFSEPMRATTLNFQSIEIRDPSNTRVPADVTYDEATFTATITPMAPLNPATPYRVVITTFVRDEAGNPISPEYDSRFSTLFEEPAGVQAVAEKWAPVIYQALGDTPNLDLPTNVNFDNNLVARDNKAKAVLSATRTTATVYYNVIESKTHYLLTYVLYYPARVGTNDRFEHDFTGATFVIDKATDAFVVAEGVRVEQGSDAAFGFKPDDSMVTGTGRLATFPAASFEDGRFPMFVPSGLHEACSFPIDGDPPFCLHNAGEMPGGPSEGVVLRPGPMGQQLRDAVENVDTGFREMTYELVPLASTLWAWRTNVGQDSLWEQSIVYAPMGVDRPSTNTSGSPIVIPTRLVSDDETSYGKSPFQWLRSPSETNYGQWLIDPTAMLTARYDFGATWSTEYCYNIFLGVNLRGDANNPECATD